MAWTGGSVVEFRFLHTVVVGSISNGEDHRVHCWWDLIRSKQLFSAPFVAFRCLPDFLVMVILRYICVCIGKNPSTNKSLESSPLKIRQIPTKPIWRGALPHSLDYSTWYVPYNAQRWAKWYQVPFLESLVWLNLRMNPGLPANIQPQGQYVNFGTCLNKRRLYLHKIPPMITDG